MSSPPSASLASDTAATATAVPAPQLSPIALAARGLEIPTLDILAPTPSDIDVSDTRAAQLMQAMYAETLTGGVDLTYGPDTEAHRIRVFQPTGRPPTATQSTAEGEEVGRGEDVKLVSTQLAGSQLATLRAQTSPETRLIVFIHGGSWRAGSHLDSVGAAKIAHLTARGYAFASVNYRLIPAVTIEEQVQDVADAVSYLLSPCRTSSLSVSSQAQTAQLGTEINKDRVVLMGHSSGAHVAALLGTDPRYFQRAGLPMSSIKGIVLLDGSNYNAPAELTDSPGPVADNLIFGMGRDLDRLRSLSPTHVARSGGVVAKWLMLHVQRRGDVRQAVELEAVLRAAGAEAELHVFEGMGFEGHVQMLLRLGVQDYSATKILERWLEGVSETADALA